MNTRHETATYTINRSRSAPRGANWAAGIAVAVGKMFGAIATPIKKSLQASSQARARNELLRMADQYDHLQPTFAAELRAAAAFDSRD
jgi:hypothetical protein